MDSAVGFAAGAAYGVTSVVVGQPLDTIKTRMQTRSAGAPIGAGAMLSARQLLATEGLRGLYRGGVPIMLGGSLFRSAQFGMYEVTVRALRNRGPTHRLGGVLDWQVAVAGAAGGLARGVVEAPFEQIKVSAQVGRTQEWTLRRLFEGCSVTLGRNVILFTTFSVSADVLPPLVKGGLSPFWTGALCANLGWLACWPMDVVKTQRQSGQYAGRSARHLLLDAARSGLLYRGLLPGLARSTIANGSAMVVYKKILEVYKL